MGINPFTSISLNTIDEFMLHPLEEKIEIADKVIRKALEISKKPAIAFSGGKYSTVVLSMVLKYKPDIIVLFNNTGVEFPETVKFVHKLAKEWKLNFYEIRPKTTFWKIVEEHGPPSHQRWRVKEPMCCYLLKTKPSCQFYRKMRIDLVFTGISAYESRVRKLSTSQRGLLYQAKNLGHYKFSKPIWRANPLGLWTDDDVWEYIKRFNIPVNPVYQKYNILRTGCLPCTGFKGWEKEMQKISPKLYELMMKMKKQSLLSDFV